MKTKLLTICSTRKRPALAAKMCASFNATKSEGTEIVFYVWEDDPFVEDYKRLLKDENVIYGEKRFMTEVLNYITKEVYPDVPYYQNINDDHLYLIKGWDELMLKPLEENNGWGISYCRGVNENENPTAEIISGKIVKALGYYMYPQFRQFGCEAFIMGLGEGLNKFYYIRGNLIAHNCVNLGKMKPDDNYKFIHGQDLTYGMGIVKKWEADRNSEIKKIKEAIKNE